MKVSYSWTLAILALVVILLSEPSVSRRTGGGRGSSSRSSSSSRGSSGGLFDGFKNVFKSKPKAPPKSPSGASYPKQQYGGAQTGGTQTGGTQSGGQTYLGGGGFVNPNKQGGGSNQGSNLGAGGFVNPNSNRNPGYNNNNNYGNQHNYGNNYGNNYGSNYGSSSYGNNYGSFGRNNYGGGYYSPSGFKQSNGLFGTGGKKAFALGAGAGFIGGAVAGVGAMAVYHRYQQFKTMMYYKAMMGGGYGGYGGYGMGYGYSPYGIHGQSILVNAHDCVGGCPMQAFCDMGICRCREGYEARFGSCYQNFNSIYNTKQNEFNERWQPSFDPYKSCTEHKDCWKVDMNMICSTNTTRCACRDDMRWNLDTGECQVFMDVDCSGVKPKVMALDSETPSTSSTTSAPEEVSTSSTSTENPATTTTDLSSPVTPTPDLSGNDTLDAFPDKNLTEISVNDTLQDSGLTKININETSAEDIKAAFCKEIGQITKRFDRQVDNRQIVRDNRKELGEAALGAGAIALIVLLVCCCCGCLCLCVCINKVKEVFGGMFEQKGEDNYAPAAEVQMESYNEAPGPPTTKVPPYPMDNPPLSGYPPEPVYPNMNGMNNTPYPPGQPAYNPGYNGNSDNVAPPYPVYPPNGGGQPPPYPI